MGRPTVAVIGAGATAAFIVAACQELGSDVDVFSSRVGSPKPGAFYFHWVPEGVSESIGPIDILYYGIGDEKGYLVRQWPRSERYWQFGSSFPEEPCIVEGWDAYACWDALWGNTFPQLLSGQLSDRDVKDYALAYDLVFFTFPSDKSIASQPVTATVPIITYPHKYKSLESLSIPLLSEESWILEHPHWIVYNGEGVEGEDWVRMSCVSGKLSWEYPYTLLPMIKDEMLDATEFVQDIYPGTKPWHQALAPTVIPLGRLALWDRGYLSHYAFFDAWNILSDWREGKREWETLDLRR